MGLAHCSGTAHPVQPARGRLAQGPPGKIPNARLVPRPTVPLPTDRHHAHGTVVALVSHRPRFHCPTTRAVHHLTLSATVCRSQSLLLLFALPATRSALQWPPELPPRVAVDRVPHCLIVCFAGPRRVAECRPDPEPPPATSSTATSSMTSSSSHRPGPRRPR
jgi:hypothetical protein